MNNRISTDSSDVNACVAKEWTKQEIATLKANYNVLSNNELKSLFPNRSAIGIYRKAYKLGLRKTPEMKHMNRSLAHKKEVNEVITNKKGYRLLHKPEHPRADKKGRVFEHIVVYEDATGIVIPKGWCIHHLNENKSDNRIENLCLMTCSAHSKLHQQGRKYTDAEKAKMSEIAKARFKDKRNHPNYKNVDMKKAMDLRKSGMTVKQVCEKLGISKFTYYKKMEELE